MERSGDIANSKTRLKLVRAPLVTIALAFIAGILLGRYTPFNLGFWAALGFSALIVAGISLIRKHLRLLTSISLLTVVLSLGGAYVRFVYFSIPENHIVTYSGESTTLATLKGTVATTPQIFEPAFDKNLNYSRPPRTSFLLQASKIKTDDGWTDTDGLVRVTIHQPAGNIRLGQKVKLVGKIGRYRQPDNPGQYDWAQAARNKKTFVWMAVPLAKGAAVLTDEKQPWFARLYWHLRTASRQHLASYGGREGKLLNALILGERHLALQSLSKTMVRSGIAHFLSISGLHLGVFLGLIFLVCRLFTLTPSRSAKIVLIVLACYLLLAEPRAPVLRSAIMATMLCMATIFHRRNTALNALAGAAIMLLIIDPLELFQPGFQLSFVIVAGILLLHTRVKHLLFGRWMSRRGLMVFRDDQRWKRRLYYTLSNFCIDAVTIAITAYLMGAPLVAYHFGLFSPYAPLLSILLFPFVAAVLVPGYISIAIAWPLPNLSYSFGLLASKAADMLASIVELTAKLPALCIELKPVTIVWTSFCYAAILAILLATRKGAGKILAGILVIACIGLTYFTQRTSSPPSQAELNILAVGAGQCVLLRTPAGKTYIFDAGTLNSVDLYEQMLSPFIQHEKLPHPSDVFISHANIDHYNALPKILENCGPESVYLNDYFGRRENPSQLLSPAVASVMQSITENDAQIVRLRGGMNIDLGARTTLEVLWPNKNTPKDISTNDTSLVLRITCDDVSVLIAGDLSESGQSRLVYESGGIKADILLIPHHGGWENSLPGFLEAIQPSHVIVSNSHEPRPAANSPKASGEFYRNLRSNYKYFSTSTNGWIKLSFGNGKVHSDTMR